MIRTPLQVGPGLIVMVVDERRTSNIHNARKKWALILVSLFSCNFAHMKEPSLDPRYFNDDSIVGRTESQC